MIQQPYISTSRIVLSGNILEVFNYSQPIGYQLISTGKKVEHFPRRDRDKQEITASSLSRTKNRLMRLINANCNRWPDLNHKPIKPLFLTYTFKDNLTDINLANTYYTNYIKRLNYHHFANDRVRYVVVPEFQKRGAVHYHAVFFNLVVNTRSEFRNGHHASLWSHGFIKTKKIDSVPNIGIYMTKYFTKSNIDKRLVGRRKYFSSRGLHKPTVITYPPVANQIVDFLESLYTPINTYRCEPTEKTPHSPENPFSCATYNLPDKDLHELLALYNIET